ncbi:MAG: hypothetical protein KGL39_30695 [Patescibacteria group bacterium]|nr:hypothetical protein [Patescibacteria group bacterium]
MAKDLGSIRALYLTYPAAALQHSSCHSGGLAMGGRWAGGGRPVRQWWAAGEATVGDW